MFAYSAMILIELDYHLLILLMTQFQGWIRTDSNINTAFLRG